MKKFLTLSSGFVLFVSLFAADTDKRHTEPAGGFSFCPPKDWVIREVAGMKYKFAFGPLADGFAPNINVVDESFTGSLQAYVKANLETLPKVFKGFKKLGQSDFKTDSGMNGVKIIIQSEQQGHAIRQSFFFFEGKADKKLVATCSALAEGGAKLDSAFEASMKTFAIEK